MDAAMIHTVEEDIRETVRDLAIELRLRALDIYFIYHCNDGLWGWTCKIDPGGRRRACGFSPDIQEAAAIAKASWIHQINVKF